MNGRMIKNCL